MSEYIRDDYSVRINIDAEDGELSLLVSAKYDRIDHFPRLGFFLMKVIDPEHGFICMAIDEGTAQKLYDTAELPICDRDTIFKSEYEMYLKAQSQQLDDSWLEEPS